MSYRWGWWTSVGGVDNVGETNVGDDDDDDDGADGVDVDVNIGKMV